MKKTVIIIFLTFITVLITPPAFAINRVLVSSTEPMMAIYGLEQVDLTYTVMEFPDMMAINLPNLPQRRDCHITGFGTFIARIMEQSGLRPRVVFLVMQETTDAFGLPTARSLRISQLKTD